MSKERFIGGRHDDARHDGRHSTMKRLQGAMEQIQAWRRERTLANEAGHTPELCYPGEIGGHFIDQIPEDEEIVLFDGERNISDTTREIQNNS